MLKRVTDWLAGLPMTAVSGVCLLLSLLLRLRGGTGALPLDPAWAAVVISGAPLLYLAVWRMVHNPGISKISSALLISIAMCAAVAIGDLFAAGEVAFIMAIGAILEERTTQRARKGLTSLIRLTPVQGRLLTESGETMVPIAQIRPGDRLRILPGEAVPVDGVILCGQTSVDQSILTGESLPVDKGPGGTVYCGTINRFGAVEVEAAKAGEDSSLHLLIRMVREAEAKQAPMQRIADRAASWLVPVALLIAAVAYFGTGELVKAVTVLVVFCPCALVLATPTAIMAAIGQATRHGVIIKSGEALERMGKADVVALDKTGTLTFGRPDVSDIAVCADGWGQTALLVLCASAETHSEHPLGKAVTAHAQARGLALHPAADFCMTAGRGIRATVEGRQVWCGSAAWLTGQGIPLSALVQQTLHRLQDEGKAAILVADAAQCLGVIALSDTLRPETPQAVARLHDMGVHTVLLTGDNRQAAACFAAQAGVDDVQAELLPADKVASLAVMQQAGHTVCMVGDGVNDAPALKTADVSVAMGCMGSDIAVDAADIALMRDDIAMLPYLKRLSNATVATIKLSITLSMCINFAAIVLSLCGLLTPTTGALVHNAGSCFVVLIAALLYDRRFD